MVGSTLSLVNSLEEQLPRCDPPAVV
jgi:hypothetical protein